MPVLGWATFVSQHVVRPTGDGGLWLGKVTQPHVSQTWLSDQASVQNKPAATKSQDHFFSKFQRATELGQHRREPEARRAWADFLSVTQTTRQTNTQTLLVAWWETQVPSKVFCREDQTVKRSLATLIIHF